ncbi:hypothetical protein HanPI659440_Chr13g0490501 [Helianthus annuus]|nr:hypothetical protein HanPI659440_Chr13g0490501 [Helianthus annuus]
MLLLVLIWPPTPFSWVTPEEEELFVPHSESVATEGSQPMEGGCSYSRKETMWTICQCILMLVQK